MADSKVFQQPASSSSVDHVMPEAQGVQTPTQHYHTGAWLQCFNITKSCMHLLYIEEWRNILDTWWYMPITIICLQFHDPMKPLGFWSLPFSCKTRAIHANLLTRQLEAKPVLKHADQCVMVWEVKGAASKTRKHYNINIIFGDTPVFDVWLCEMRRLGNPKWSWRITTLRTCS